MCEEPSDELNVSDRQYAVVSLLTSSSPTTVCSSPESPTLGEPLLDTEVASLADEDAENGIGGRNPLSESVVDPGVDRVEVVEEEDMVWGRKRGGGEEE